MTIGYADMNGLYRTIFCDDEDDSIIQESGWYESPSCDSKSDPIYDRNPAVFIYMDFPLTRTEVLRAYWREPRAILRWILGKSVAKCVSYRIHMGQSKKADA